MREGCRCDLYAALGIDAPGTVQEYCLGKLIGYYPGGESRTLSAFGGATLCRCKKDREARSEYSDALLRRGSALLKLKPKTFMGERLRNWNSNDLCVDLSHYEAGCVFPKHGHVDAFYCFVLNGACEENVGGRREILRPGSLIYHPPGFEHSNRWHEEGRCMHVEFASGFSEGAPQARLADLVIQTRHERASGIVLNIHDELFHPDSASEIALEGLALQLVAETIREAGRESKTPRWLYAVRDQLHEEYQAVPSLKRMAASVGVHPTYLASCFHQHFGVTVGEFVRSRRIAHAREILANSNDSLSEVALRLGFSDQSHFCRTFKKQVGLSPLQYRRLFFSDPNPVQLS